ncbi:DUF484 family protein [Paroceanicella profunda]|uniref:DUF484 family protein n=1 Tax=Paroceanicella profunda TaxID=2579971 RepID=A0A5B8FVG6_9RHOB|nr:DUF484 family protein [Paroceanicella profunda]QDL91120.1 DUF484 family protein [Paroceanicella profunda]
MPTPLEDSAEFKAQILKDPEALLEDAEVMKALISAGEARIGRNVVDLRGVLVERLESRLGRLEDTHRSVISAAYENLAGTNQIHRAVLALLDHQDFGTFLDTVANDLPNILAVDFVRVGLETTEREAGLPVGPVGPHAAVAVALAPGAVAARFGVPGAGGTHRAVLLRQSQAADSRLFGDREGSVRSEALLRLDLGHGRLPGLLILGAEDPRRFSPDQGVDLLTFFGAVFERALRRWAA